MTSQFLNPNLKFRVFDKVEKCLCDDHPLFISKEGELLRRKVTSVRDDFNTFRFERLNYERYEVHLNTGLKDSHNQPIFEKDCVWNTRANQFQEVSLRTGLFICCFKEQKNEFKLLNEVLNDIIVVGHLYEDVSVLEEKLRSFV